MKTFIISLSALFLFSCGTNESKIDNSLKKYFNETAKDPSSYEPMETKVIDTLLVSDIAKLKIESLNSEKEDYEYNIEEVEIKRKNSSAKMDSLYLQMIDNSKSQIELVNNNISKYNDKLKNDSVYALIVEHKFRAKNSLGALNISEDVFALDKNLNVKTHDKTESKIIMQLINSF